MIICEITEVTPEVYAKEAEEFIERMQAIGKAKEDKHFHVHADGAATIAESYHPVKISGKRYLAFAKSGDKVFGLAGLMILSLESSYAKVHFLCTHPLTSQAGLFLIKHAVTVSKEHGKGGTLRLYDASRSDFYDNLGFTLLADGDKELLNGVIKDKS